MTILVVVAVTAERDAVVRELGDTQPLDLPSHPGGLRAQSGAGEVHIVVSGVGPVPAAVATTRALASADYAAVISAGVGGGFVGRANVGDLVVADEAVAADLGIDSPDGFQTLGELDWTSTKLAVAADIEPLVERLVTAGLPVRRGRVVTVNTSTGTDERSAELAARWLPVAEAMEGWGVWWAARQCSEAPTYEIRAICNTVGRRDRAAWDVDGALDVLSRAFAVLLAEPLP